MPLLGPDGNPLNEPPETAQPVPENTGPIPCVTAFVVYMLPDGRWQVSDDLDVPLQPVRKPVGDDFTAGCAVIHRDAQTQEIISVMARTIGPSIVQSTLQNIPQALSMFGQAVRQDAEAAKVARDIERERHLRGGR